MKKLFAVRLDVELIRKIKMVAAAKGTTVSAIVEKALEKIKPVS